MALVVLIAVLMVICIGQLFRLRFARGDIYPPYSSFRADPLGTKALFESVGQVRAWEATRNVRDIGEGTLTDDTALLIIGASEWLFCSTAERQAMERGVAKGGCLVIAFAEGKTSRPFIDLEDPDEEADEDEAEEAARDENDGPDESEAAGSEEEEEEEEEEEGEAAFVSMRELLEDWGVDMAD